MIKLACSISSIARHINRSRTTIYNELKRGRVEQIKNGHKVIVYCLGAGQTQYEKNRKNSKKKFKVLECVDFIKFVEKSFKEQYWSLEHISFLLVFYFVRFKLYTRFDVCSYFFAKNLALGENFLSPTLNIIQAIKIDLKI